MSPRPDCGGLTWRLQGGRLNWPAVREALPRHRGVSVLSGTRRGYEMDAGPVAAIVDAGRRGGVAVVCDLPAATDRGDACRTGQRRPRRAGQPLRCAGVRGRRDVAPVLAAINPNLGLVVRGPSPGGLRAAEVADIAGVPLLAAMRPEPGLAERLEHGGLRLGRRSALAAAARRVLECVAQQAQGAAAAA